jgi:hypothetical protein
MPIAAAKARTAESLSAKKILYIALGMSGPSRRSEKLDENLLQSR